MGFLFQSSWLLWECSEAASWAAWMETGAGGGDYLLRRGGVVVCPAVFLLGCGGWGFWPMEWDFCGGFLLGEVQVYERSCR